MEWKVAFPMHPEYRTLPMVGYIPPLSPIQNAAEAGAIGSPPAVINAVVDALQSGGHNVTHVDMPASPQNVWAAIQAAK